MGRNRKKKTGQSVYRLLKGKKRRKTVTCRICGARLQRINGPHLATHGMTGREYKEKYGVQHLASEEQRYRVSVRNLRRSPDDILKSIRAMAGEGLLLYASEIAQSHRKLYSSARYVFGTWLNAVEAAGLDPDVHTKPHPRYRWSREVVVREIKERHALGLPMHHAQVKRDNWGLAYAGEKYFGLWGAALRAAGLDPEEVAFGWKWPKRKVIRTLLARAAEGKPINSRYVYLHAADLWNAAAKRFGNWESALRAAGLDPDEVRMFRIWGDNKSLLAEIRRHAETGLPMNFASMQQRDQGILATAIKRFGDWDNALREAGLNPREHRLNHPRWTRESIIQAIQEQSRPGERLKSTQVKPKSIYMAALRIFGSWQAALDAASNQEQDTR